MSSFNRLVVPAIILIAMMMFSLVSVNGEDVNDQGHLCNPKVNADESPEEWDISYLISKLIEDTPSHGYYQHISYNKYDGVAACNGQIPKEDCSDCLDFANNLIFKACGFGNGAQIKLGDCRLRYENYVIAGW